MQTLANTIRIELVEDTKYPIVWTATRVTLLTLATDQMQLHSPSS